MIAYYADKILIAIESGLDKQTWKTEMLVSRCNWQRVTESALKGELLEVLMRIASKELDVSDPDLSDIIDRLSSRLGSDEFTEIPGDPMGSVRLNIERTATKFLLATLQAAQSGDEIEFNDKIARIRSGG